MESIKIMETERRYHALRISWKQHGSAVPRRPSSQQQYLEWRRGSGKDRTKPKIRSSNKKIFGSSPSNANGLLAYGGGRDLAQGRAGRCYGHRQPHGPSKRNSRIIKMCIRDRTMGTYEPFRLFSLAKTFFQTEFHKNEDEILWK